MTCTDYQSIIRQWFEDVMETHISKCDSCTQFFLELNKGSIRQLEQQSIPQHIIQAMVGYGVQPQPADAQSHGAQPSQLAPMFGVPGGAPAQAGLTPYTAPAVQGFVQTGQGFEAPTSAPQPGMMEPGAAGLAQPGMAQPGPGMMQPNMPQPGTVQSAPPQSFPPQDQSQGMYQQPLAQQPIPGTAQIPNMGAPPQVPPPALPRKAVMGRLNPGPEIDPTSPGLICNIGRFILDDRELEMLRGMATTEPSELGLRVLTIKALEDLKNILNDITMHEEVIGWAIIGSDGLLVAGALPEELNAENLAVRALSIYMGTEEMLERIGNERIQQIILQSEVGAVYLANFGEGVFVTISNGNEPEAIIRTLKRIRDVS